MPSFSDNGSEHDERVAAVMSEIDRRGSYDLTFKELSFGCRMAWRNAPRCMNRIQWRKLVVFDQRDVQTAEEMFAAMVRHIRFCTNPENPGVLRWVLCMYRSACSWIDRHLKHKACTVVNVWVWFSSWPRQVSYHCLP